MAARYPTPTASMVTTADMEQARYAGKKGGNRPSYQDAKAKWPTPYGLSGNQGQGDGEFGKAVRNSTEDGGQLNPTWVEWLMGWPLGWTDCGASAMAKFREWCRSHGIS
jgi:hypothetical protein